MAKKPLPRMPSMKAKSTTKAADKPKTAVTKKKDTAPVPNAKTHERKAKPAEVNRIERGKRLAAAYLTQRDGMDEDTARIVVDSMEPADVDALIVEANTATIERTAARTTDIQAAPTPAATDTPAAAPVAAPENVQEDVAPDDHPIDFLSVPALADDDTFTEIVIRCRENAAIKNDAEQKYRADKKIIDNVLAEAGIGKLQPVDVLGGTLTRYTGKGPPVLSVPLLLQKGVDIDVINQCWVQTEYDDVRFSKVKI